MRRDPFGSVHVIESLIFRGCSLKEKTIFGPDPPGYPCAVFALIIVGAGVVVLAVVCETQAVVVTVKLTAICTAALCANLAAFSVFDALQLGSSACTIFCNESYSLVATPCELVSICACVAASVIYISYPPLVAELNISGLTPLSKSTKLCHIEFNCRITISAFVSSCKSTLYGDSERLSSRLLFVAAAV